jgi:hypothetical protein
MTSAQPTDRRVSIRMRASIVALVWVGVVAVGLELVRPSQSAPIAFDTAASVLHFDRIVSGQHIEALITTTPKPWLTLVDGLLYQGTSDWRAVWLATLMAFAAAIAIATAVALELGGPIAAAAVAVGLAGSSELWADVGVALAVAWALLGLAVALSAVTHPRPQWGLAGAALLAASLARIEVLVLVPVALACLAWSWRADLHPTRRPWLVAAVPMLALPIMLIHDWLLAGDPLFWTKVAQIYSAAVSSPILSPAEMLATIVEHVAGEPLWSSLAILGIVGLVHGRQRLVGVGLLGLILGVLGMLLGLAARHLYVPSRYFLPVDAAVIFAAGFGLAEILEWVRRRPGFARPRSLGAIAAAAGMAGAVGAGWPVASVDRSLGASLQKEARLADHLATVLPGIRANLTSIGQGASMSVPLPLRPAVVVETGLSIPSVRVNRPPGLDAASLGPGAMVVFHDRLGDLPPDAFTSLEVAAPAAAGSFGVRSIDARPDLGYWLLLVTPGR